jgi:predicted ATP-binding protein involved in virulence
MRIKKLSVSGLRAFSQADFEFQPGMNLLVGINGVGKTTVLDALRISLSKVLPIITSSKNRKDGFEVTDIKIGSASMQISCDFEFFFFFFFII